jgi:D-alanyl-D-alanine carboxypeptidase
MTMPDQPDAQLQALLQKGIARGYPGIAMLVQNASGEVRSAAVGYSDLARRTPLRVDDAFHMASITKTFTAVATLRLVDQGKLALDGTLSGTLGTAVERLPHADQITIAQLLDHSSGIYPTNNDMAYLDTVIGPNADPSRAWTPEELVALADEGRSEPAGLPGQDHFYADTNYILLGMIVERVSKRPFKQHVRETLLQPLGMRSTYFYSDYLGGSGPAQVETVRGYLLATDELRSAIQIHARFQPVPGGDSEEGVLLDTTLAAERIDAAAGLVTTLPDLSRYASALFNGRLLSARNQAFLTAAAEGMSEQPVGTKRVWTLQAVNQPHGVLLYKEGDGPGGVNTLMACSPASGQIFLGFANVFGYFSEVDFMLDEVIAEVVTRA